MHRSLHAVRIALRIAAGAVALALGGAAQTACDNCPYAGPPSPGFSISGTIAIPDALLTSLDIQICLGGNCWSNTNTDDALVPPTIEDAGDANIVVYSFCLGSTSTGCWGSGGLLKVSNWSYQISGMINIENGGDGDVTVNITSGGTVVYQTSGHATCETLPSCGQAMANCTFQLQ